MLKIFRWIDRGNWGNPSTHHIQTSLPSNSTFYYLINVSKNKPALNPMNKDTESYNLLLKQYWNVCHWSIFYLHYSFWLLLNNISPLTRSAFIFFSLLLGVQNCCLWLQSKEATLQLTPHRGHCTTLFSSRKQQQLFWSSSALSRLSRWESATEGRGIGQGAAWESAE